MPDRVSAEPAGVPLHGGHSGRPVVRVGATVRRPLAPSSAAVHALLRHLETVGFSGAPRLLGVDDEQREVLEWVPGEIVHHGAADPLTAEDVREVGAVVRAYHEAVASFAAAKGATWSERGQDPSGVDEVICHNDLATWNLVRSDDRWVFIDWDLAAPGRRAWDLAWTVCSLVGLVDDDVDDAAAHADEHVRALLDGYGEEATRDEVLELAVQRARREAASLRTRAEAGDPLAAALVEDGHVVAWAATARRVAALG